MAQTLADVIGQSDRSECPVSDGLIVDDGVTRNNYLIDNQSPLIGQRCENSLMDDCRDIDYSLRYWSSVAASCHDPIANLNFGRECDA